MVCAAVLFASGAEPAAAQCWTPEQLAARPQEKLVRRQTRAEVRLPDTAGLSAAPVPERLRGSIRRVKLPPGRKLIALTFDLCEQYGEVAGYDGGVIDYLRANRIKATFFGGGKWLVSHPERGQQIMAGELFEIGNHGWSHQNLRMITGGDLLGEINMTTAAYRETREGLAGQSCMAGSRRLAAIPELPKLMRFPYGTCSPEALAAVADAGMLAIQWDVETADPWKLQTAKGIVDTVMKSARPGSIVVAHANGRGWHTAEALPLLIPQLRAKGFEFVTVSELLAAGEPEIAATCYELRPGDNERYNTPNHVKRLNDAPSGPGRSNRPPPAWTPVEY